MPCGTAGRPVAAKAALGGGVSRPFRATSVRFVNVVTSKVTLPPACQV